MDEPFAPPIMLPDQMAWVEELPRFRADQLKMSVGTLDRICQEYGFDKVMIKRAITPQDERLVMLDDMAVEKFEFDSTKSVVIARVRTPPDEIVAILRDEVHQAREELSRKLRTMPIKKGASGAIGPKAVTSYLSAMMVQAVAETSERMPPSLAALVRDQLCVEHPELLTLACADLDEEDAIARAATIFGADERISIEKAANRLGLSVKVVRRLFAGGFKEKLHKWRETMSAAQMYARKLMNR